MGYLLLGLFGIVPKLGLYFDLSLLVIVGSIISIFLLNVGSRFGIYIVEWEDSRDTSGMLEISYVKSNGRRRTGLIVESVEAHPNRPLLFPTGSRYRPAVPVGGTGGSLVIHFKNSKQKVLGLGFADVDEMNKVYEQLK